MNNPVTSIVNPSMAITKDASIGRMLVEQGKITLEQAECVNRPDRDLALLDQLAAARVALNAQIARRVIGQRDVIDNLIAAILAGGHALLVGVPGLAKTLLVQTVAQALDLRFSRVQFTPDLMPSDITGTELLEEDHATGRRFFKFVEGPVFANIVLADEINRAPPKTQAALLQAMQPTRNNAITMRLNQGGYWRCKSTVI